MLTEEELAEINFKPSEEEKRPRFQRVLTDCGLDLDTQRNLKLLDLEINIYKSKIIEPQTYINCDLRYFNLDFLIEKIGNFDGRKSSYM